MANMCIFQAKVVGNKEGINKLLNALQQEGNTWIGRGAEVWIDQEKELNNGEVSVTFSGECKWSMLSAFVDNAKSMRHQKETGEGCWGGINKDSKEEFLTIFEAVEKYDLDFEAWSEEEGCEFQEHILTTRKNRNTNILCVDWGCWYIDQYDTKEEAEEELGVKLTEEQWNNGNGATGEGTTNWGGFPEAYTYHI